MATISFGGLGNGLDFGKVVDQLVKVQRVPIDQLEAKKTALQTKLTDYGTLGTKLLALQSASDSLRLQSSFDRTSASVSDEDVLAVSASSTATQGSYQLRVTQLATANQLASKAAKAVAATSTDIVSGSSAGFSFRVGTGAVQTVTLGDSATLEDLRTAINDLGAGATASIVNAGTSATPAYRLLVTATNTGADHAITITADGTDLDFLNTTGTGGTDTLQAAQDAMVVLGDPSQTALTIQRSSNTVTDAIPGVTLNLKKETALGETVAVNVTLDTGAIKKNVQAFVTAYNEIVQFVNERATYDPVAKKGGIFLGDGAARTTIANLRQALASDVAGLTIYSSVGQIGFQTERDGTIKLDEGKLDTALSTNYTAVKTLFINQTTITGVAQRISAAVDRLDDVESGSVSGRKDGLTEEITRLSDDIKRKEDALSAFEERLRRQYATLDSLLSQLQSQGDFLRARLSSSQGASK